MTGRITEKEYSKLADKIASPRSLKKQFSSLTRKKHSDELQALYDSIEWGKKEPGDARKTIIPKAKSEGEEILAMQLKAEGIHFTREFRFASSRKWKFDFAINHLDAGGRYTDNIAIECQGASWSAGRHTMGKGYADDCIRLAEAIIRGWRVFYFTTEQIRNGTAIEYIKRALQ